MMAPGGDGAGVGELILDIRREMKEAQRQWFLLVIYQRNGVFL